MNFAHANFKLLKRFFNKEKESRELKYIYYIPRLYIENYMK